MLISISRTAVIQIDNRVEESDDAHKIIQYYLVLICGAFTVTTTKYKYCKVTMR